MDFSIMGGTRSIGEECGLPTLGRAGTLELGDAASSPVTLFCACFFNSLEMRSKGRF